MSSNYNQIRYRCCDILGVAMVLVALSVVDGDAREDGQCIGRKIDAGLLAYDAKNIQLVGVAGRRYVFADIVFPEPDNDSATIANQINAMIGNFIERGTVTVAVANGKEDRFGRKAVRLFIGNDDRRVSLQRQLVANGLALAHPDENNGGCIQPLLIAEKMARNAGSGIWNTGKFAIMASTDKDWQSRTNRYQLVTGRVLSVGNTRSRTYLNFGTDWKEDFTVVIAKKRIKRFIKAYGDLAALAGRIVRVRGWLVSNRGPMIEVYYPGQIELELD